LSDSIFAEIGAQFHAAEILDIGLTARLIKVTIKGCRASDTEIFSTLFDN
jgi:hypothetical protein